MVFIIYEEDEKLILMYIKLIILNLLFLICCKSKSNIISHRLEIPEMIVNLKANKINNKILNENYWVADPFYAKCFDYLYFNLDATFTFVNNCGVLDSVYGRWQIKEDTIILEQLGSYEMTEDFTKIKYKVLYVDSNLVWIFAYYWIASQSEFSNNAVQLNKKLNTFKRISRNTNR